MAEGMKSSDFSAVLFSWTGFVLFCGLAKDWALDLLLCIVSRCKTSLTEVHSNRAEQLLLLSFLRPESCCNFPWLRLTHLPCMSWEVGFSLTSFISTAEREYKTEEGINRTEKIKIMFFSWTCGAWKFFEFLICESDSFSSEHVWANETQTANWSSFRRYLCQEKKICKKKKVTSPCIKS